MLVQNLPEGMTLWTLLGVSLISFIGSFITVAFGIGGGVLVIATLAGLLPPAALIPVHGVVQLASNATRAGVFFRHILWGALPWFAVGSVVGAAVGGLVVVDLDPSYVLIGVGIFVIWSVVRKPPEWLKRWPWLTGVISSFLTMFFGATGIFVAGYVKSLALGRHAHVATHASLMAIQHSLKIIVFGLLGFGFADWGLVIAAMIAFGLAGTLSGRLVLARVSEALFRRALDIILIVLSLRLIWMGVRGLTG